MEASFSKKTPGMTSLIDLIQLHKWTFVQFFSVFLTIPALGDMPEVTGYLGFLAFVFATWRQWRDEVRKTNEERRREELHVRKMRLLDDIRSGVIHVDEDIFKSLVADERKPL